MRPPVLARPLVLEARARVADGAGGFADTWEARGTLWAEVAAGSGSAAEGGDVALGALGLRIVVRAAPQGAPERPEPGQRFRDGARLYAILAVSERDGAGRHLLCHAREEVVR